MTNCHTYYGRYNRVGDAPQMIEYFKKNSVTLERAKNMTPEELKDKIVIGEFHVEEKPTFHDRYTKIIESIAGKE